MSQPRYRRELRKWLRDELQRLEQGNRTEKQRYTNAMSAMLKVMADPISREFSKTLPENYKAVDVLQQVRLFFKIVDDPSAPQTGERIIYFVWMNGDEVTHQSGESDDCYQVFRRMVINGEIEPYQPAVASKPLFRIHGEWGEAVIYASYEEIRSHLTERADSHLHLNRVTSDEYRIEAITVSTENEGLASGLLKNLCDHSDRSNITLTYELWAEQTNSVKQRHILEKFDFYQSEQIEDIEIWIRVPVESKSKKK